VRVRAGASVGAGAGESPGTIERGAFGPAGGVLATVLGFGAGDDAGRAALRAVGVGGTGAASKPRDGSARIVTVWIFFGSDETGAGAAAAGGRGPAVGAGGAPPGEGVAGAAAVGAGATGAGGAEL